MRASDDLFSKPGTAPFIVRTLVRMPWSFKRWIWSHPSAWRAFSGACRRLGWNERALGVYRADNGPYAGISVRASHVNHLWALMGGYEPDVSEWVVHALSGPTWRGEGRDVYDVGAYVGLTALLLARHADRVVAFEPSPANRDALERNLAINPELATKIHVVPAAASDRAGMLEMTFDGVQSTSQIKTAGVELWSDADALPVTSTEARPLDALLDETPPGGPWRPGFIKIDVEGAEGLVLAGATETLRRFRPSLLIETHNDGACTAVFAALQAANYTVLRFDAGTLSPAKKAWPGGYGHVAALPSERAAGMDVRTA